MSDDVSAVPPAPPHNAEAIDAPPPDSPAAAWGSRIGVILAVAGSAVGLGNFLRFPGQAAQNGGGAFMIPYFISLLILGIPLAWVEWTIGRYGGLKGFNSAPGIYASVWRNRFAKYLGALAVLIPLSIYFYYVLIEAWCLGYAIDYLMGNLNLGTDVDAYGDHFNGFVGANENGALFSGKTLYILAATFALNFFLIWRGVDKGIETFCKIAIPAMVVLAVIVLIRVMTLGAPVADAPERDVEAGLGFMWNPDFKALLNGETWLAAAGQIFFSLSVGFGVVINYSSYMKRRDDVALSGLTASSMNEFFEVCLGGMITLPAAFIFLGVSAGTLSTFGLGFNALPNVFAQMPGGQWFGFAWFTMLFLAAVTSSVSMLNPVFAFLEEALQIGRNGAVAVLLVLGILGTGTIAFFSEGLMVLDTVDFWIGTFALFVLALAQVLMYGWAFGIEKGEREMHVGAHIRVPRFVQYLLKYVSPAFLLIVFTAFCVQNLPDRLSALAETENRPALGAVLGVLGLLALIVVTIGVTARRWDPAELEQKTATGEIA
ncbi:sodium-dependent transporter [Alienimonas californiensis]|uniref:Sodium:neurotransmitter symporter family protein n=1 Tax=Alienimonas californiensis TaxID=2527989 RepID=A0A517PDS5_9PLAN|nr:sodium-dependent transporter [Alienimonas californiensis]QDT17532.1 Sodium:neurotransmitter symporter family protein [Alienimonas californiensis]